MHLLDKYVSAQYRRPSGIVGRYIGHKMMQQHAPENQWTIDLLNAQPADRLLEIGFGGGYAIQQLSRHVTQGKLAGIDYSRTMVAEARRRNAAAVASGLVDLRHAEASQLPFGDGEFDKAYSIHSIYFWKDPLQALREIHRILRPAGMLVLTLLPKANLDEVGTPDFAPYSGIELQAMLKLAGFLEIAIRDGRTETHKSNYSVIGTR